MIDRNTRKNSPFSLQRLISVCMILLLLLAGCGNAEEEKVVVVDNSETGALYGLIPVTREDVILTKMLNTTWVQDKEQEVSFPVGGKRVSKVHVRPGDSVKPGDLLIELSSDGLESEIDRLNYQIRKNELELSYLDAAEGFEREDTYNNFVYNTPEIEEEDVKQYEKNEASIADNYRYKREDLSDEIEFDRKKLAHLQSELSGSRIYSTMTGTVYTVTSDLEGSTSRKDMVVMTIVDNSTGHFEMSEPEYASCFREGVSVPLKIIYGSASGEYEVVPLQMDKWDDIQQFEIFSGPDNEGIDVGTSATIYITLDRRDQVLSLPVGAVYSADGKPYVYVLDDSGFRQLKWIETGLVGNDRIEITGGLEEGDQVVKQ
ncbi:MAG: efflux RND transporter periplasmic adaptor subunit [Lachnospiraceae bacterium]|nr:efflux RND transporter periplasmic adaptor subunit [Lachnospiraceae bacterium]